MHKKLAADLTSLAHGILQMKNKDDVFALKKKAYEVYEKLSVLAYVEEYINNTPNPEYTKTELLEKVERVAKIVEKETTEFTERAKVTPKIAEGVKDNDQEELKKSTEILEAIQENAKEEKTGNTVVNFETPVEDVKQERQENIQNKKEDKKLSSLEKELQDTIPVDVMADLFENAPKKSLNNKLQGDIQIGLNDRIAFVKHLFDGSQKDFNRVVSQLNTFKTEKEAKKFINKMVKPDYDWLEKEKFEERFMTIVERKFL